MWNVILKSTAVGLWRLSLRKEDFESAIEKYKDALRPRGYPELKLEKFLTPKQKKELDTRDNMIPLVMGWDRVTKDMSWLKTQWKEFRVLHPEYHSKLLKTLTMAWRSTKSLRVFFWR